MSKLIDIFSKKIINAKGVGGDILGLDANSATYLSTIDLNEYAVIKNVYVDCDIEVGFRFRISKNGEEWFEWGHLDDELCRYVNYEVTSSARMVSGKVSIKICVPFYCDLVVPDKCAINTVVVHETDGKGIDIKCVCEDISPLVGSDDIKKEQLQSGVICRITNREPKKTSIRNVHFIV